MKVQTKLPNLNLYFMGTGLDKNGNRVIKLRFRFGKRSFSVQTNCTELEGTHNVLRSGADLTPEDLKVVSSEIFLFLGNYGTRLQKERIKWKIDE